MVAQDGALSVSVCLCLTAVTCMCVSVCAGLSVTAMSRRWVGGAPAPATEMTGTATEMKREDSEKKTKS